MEPAANMSGSVEGFTQFLTVLIIFILVLIITYLTTRFIGNYQKLQARGRNIEVIEVARVGNNKFLEIVKIGRRYIVVATGKEEISFICEVSKEDIDLSADEPAANDRFKQIFEIAKDKITKRGDKQ